MKFLNNDSFWPSWPWYALGISLRIQCRDEEKDQSNGHAIMSYTGFSVIGLSVVAMALLGTFTIAYAERQEAYRLGPNDVIQVQVFGEDDLSVERTVDGNGTITFPLLGTLSVGGRTVQDFQDELTAHLRAGYIRNPKVTVFIVRHRNFFVNGEVRKPGGFEYREGMTVQKALALAEGFTEKADRSEVKITRQQGGSTYTILVALDELVLPNDLIVVAQASKLYVNGEVRRPGDYMYEKGLTVHKAITMAGGFTEKAAESRTKVLRVINGQEVTISVKLDDLIHPSDIIVVPQRFF
ncbi:MAG: SLBB domain-containing protein [Nitrospira sp.]|nr:SLBB domain-containing protein [Nitrospira sp.]